MHPRVPTLTLSVLSSFLVHSSIRRCYPGGAFDPFGFASSEDPEKIDNLKEAEIRHSRLAMVAMFGLGTQALLFNKGCLESLSYFGASFSGGN